MISGIKLKSLVGKNGKIEIQSTDFPEGTEVEIIILVDSEAQDETDYLLSNPANRDHLLNSLERSHNPDNLVVMTSDEWNEKDSL